jgi:hypothetical protein
MSTVLAETGLEFDFSRAVAAERLDAQGRAIPDGMCLVDFVVEVADEIWLVEVKRPACGGPAELAGYQARMATDELLPRLVEKCRDSYTFLHLMHRDRKPMRYVLLIDGPTPGLYADFRARLERRVRQETDVPWARHYVRFCDVRSRNMWNTDREYGQFPITLVESET